MSLKNTAVRESALFAATAGIILFLGYLQLHTRPLLVDEVLHNQQVASFLSGDFVLSKRLEMFPAFHLFAAGILRIVGAHSEAALRLIATGISAFFLLFFYSAGRELQAPTALCRAMQMLFLPLIFPFYFLFYTDIAALACLIAGIYAALRGRDLLACLCGTLALLVRQNYLPWFLFLWAFVWIRRQHQMPLRSFFSSRWYFPMVILTLCTWAFVHGGFSLQPPADTGSIAASPGNVMFFLALLPLLFAPLVIAFRTEERLALKKVAVVGTLLTAFVLTYLFFDAPHPYNMFRGHLRTYLFIGVKADWGVRAGFAALTAFGLLLLFVTRFTSHTALLLAVCTVAALLPMKLIEQRYYYPALALGLLFRRHSASKTEWALAGYGAVLSYIFFDGIVRGAWFP